MIPESLLAAYLATDYIAEHPAGRIVLRIGARSRPLDRLLRHHGVTTWAFLTAWNPFSQWGSGTINAHRQRQLETLCSGWPMFAGCGVGHGWSAEASVLVLGISEDTAIEIGRTFQQSAIVVGSLGEVARLVVLRTSS